ncbi:uncharacterized protein LOC112904710 [Agrilus planipennis]|uniref:Uncharacterized protein LOC112904710 n=1 Tax=Agrilus planipennis TaxID=224129 RepID=A0A7F5R5U6_AGRPL|nr:uncharacterized protein LOC112904710 [Agrilus planipennis]
MRNIFKILRFTASEFGKISNEKHVLFGFSAVRGLSTINDKLITPNNTILTPLSPITQEWIWKKRYPIKLPVNVNTPSLELPKVSNLDIPLEMPFSTDDNRSSIVEPPTNTDTVRKEAARLIVIRRKKMRKHKLRKLRKKMKYVWAKIRQKRELAKEKVFQAELIAQCKKAEAFNAHEYVAEKLSLACETPVTQRNHMVDFTKERH